MGLSRIGTSLRSAVPDPSVLGPEAVADPSGQWQVPEPLSVNVAPATGMKLQP